MIMDLAAGCAVIGMLVVCTHLIVMDYKHQTNLRKLKKEWEENSWPRRCSFMGWSPG